MPCLAQPPPGTWIDRLVPPAGVKSQAPAIDLEYGSGAAACPHHPPPDPASNAAEPAQPRFLIVGHCPGDRGVVPKTPRALKGGRARSDRLAGLRAGGYDRHAWAAAAAARIWWFWPWLWPWEVRPAR